MTHTQPTNSRDDAADVVEDQVSKLLPWGVSILLHAGLVLLAVFVVYSVNQQRENEQFEAVSAVFNTVPTKPLTDHLNDPWGGGSPSRTSKRIVAKPSVEVVTMGQSAATVDTHTNLTDMLTNMNDMAIDTRPIDKSYADPRIFGTEAADGGFRSIVFVVDASGSLLDVMPFVIMELKDAIRRLSHKQKFTVIFFQGSDVLEVNRPHRGMKRATGEVKREVLTWLDTASGNVTPRGSTEPIKAIQLALQYKPDLMYLLSDNITGRGAYQLDQRDLLQAIESAVSSTTKISTIQLLYPDPLARYGLMPTMQRISRQFGGRHKFVDAVEMGLK